MGADLLMSAVVIDRKTKPDWTKTLKAVAAVTDEELTDYADYIGDCEVDGEGNLTPSEREGIRRDLVAAFTALRQIVEDPNCRGHGRDLGPWGPRDPLRRNVLGRQPDRLVRRDQQGALVPQRPQGDRLRDGGVT